jgi:hypothetical protein
MPRKSPKINPWVVSTDKSHPSLYCASDEGKGKERGEKKNDRNIFIPQHIFYNVRVYFSPSTGLLYFPIGPFLKTEK